jgi:hypothetical protein
MSRIRGRDTSPEKVVHKPEFDKAWLGKFVGLGWLCQHS